MNQEQVFDIIAQHAAEVVPALSNHSFQQVDSLKALGANSVDRSEIIMMTLETLDINIPLLELGRAENIGELATIIHKKIQATVEA